MRSFDYNGVKRTECGWGGHFYLAYRCLFRRNTHLEYNGVKTASMSMTMKKVIIV